MKQRALPLLLVSAAVSLGVLAGQVGDRPSGQLEATDPLVRAVFGVGIVVFLGVEGLRVVGEIRNRSRRSADGSGAALDILWAAIPIAIVLVIAVYSLQILAAAASPAAGLTFDPHEPIGI